MGFLLITAAFQGIGSSNFFVSRSRRRFLQGFFVINQHLILLENYLWRCLQFFVVSMNHAILVSSGLV